MALRPSSGAGSGAAATRAPDRAVAPPLTPPQCGEAPESAHAPLDGWRGRTWGASPGTGGDGCCSWCRASWRRRAVCGAAPPGSCAGRPGPARRGARRRQEAGSRHDQQIGAFSWQIRRVRATPLITASARPAECLPGARSPSQCAHCWLSDAGCTRSAIIGASGRHDRHFGAYSARSGRFRAEPLIMSGKAPPVAPRARMGRPRPARASAQRGRRGSPVKGRAAIAQRRRRRP